LATSPCDFGHTTEATAAVKFALWARLYGAITFGDLVGKLGRVRIECAKCGRSGQYRLGVLIGKHGRDKRLFTWIDELTADCIYKLAKNPNDRCDARCPDLLKVGDD